MSKRSDHAEDVANLKGHRMECYISWQAYSKKVKENNYNRSFAEYLYRRFNDLTDQLIELTGDKNFAHYEMDFKTGKPIDASETSHQYRLGHTAI